jgi:cyclopropane fatty-acyl-phospholipid synthase-like methyltransferase
MPKSFATGGGASLRTGIRLPRSMTSASARMFEFYLSSCELGFRYGSLAVFQIQLSHQAPCR